jgi:hypothetical protein
VAEGDLLQGRTRRDNVPEQVAHRSSCQKPSYRILEKRGLFARSAGAPVEEVLDRTAPSRRLEHPDVEHGPEHIQTDMPGQPPCRASRSTSSGATRMAFAILACAGLPSPKARLIEPRMALVKVPD